MAQAELIAGDITGRILASAFQVHRHLGPGFLEAYYEEALAKEFELRGLSASRQHPFEVRYKGFVIGTGRLDFLVEGNVIVDLKAVEQLSPVFTAQMISYLRAIAWQWAKISCPGA